MQAVSELDEDHPHITRHREQHLPEVFGLRFFDGGKLQFIELGNAIDQLGHRFAEAGSDFGFGGRRVFDHIV